MLAYRFHTWGQPPELQEVEPPTPGPGEVVIRIGGAGACHSDLHIVSAREEFPWQLPFTLGHENAGWIEALGPGVRGWEPGEPVAVYGPWGCGHCRMCRLAAENCCENHASQGAAGGGAGRDGGMAELMLIPSTRLLVPLGDLDPVAAAPLTDAGLTPYHAIKRALPLLQPGSTAVVIGLGGLGHLALQMLRALTPTKVIAVDSSVEKVEAATAHGAHVAVHSRGEDPAAEILEHTGGTGADVVFDLVAVEPTVKLAGALSRRGGVIHAEVETFPLGEVETAYERMEAGTLKGRAVIVPGAAT